MKICPRAWVFNFSNPMSRICTTIHRKYPDLKLVGLCHEVFSLVEHLPMILKTPLSNLSFQAGGLNHFSVLLNVRYKDTGMDAYPDLRARAVAYFEKMQTNIGWALEGASSEFQQTFQQRPWAERGVFKVILEKFGYLPITTDSHFGEYIHWAYDVADLQGILDFYRAYVFWVSKQISETRLLEGTGDQWRITNILEGILTDSHHEELAVNLPNCGLIQDLPEDIVVEAPAMVDRNGVHGIPLGKFPKAFAGLLHNQYAVHDLTAEAVLTKSRAAALQALLVDPVVQSVRAAEQTLEAMLNIQKTYLGYLK
jgi:alpha-galactosidase